MADDAARLGALRRAARAAWLFTVPLIEMARTRSASLNPPAPRPAVPANRFRHFRKLSGPSNRVVSAPNNDTLFSSAWVDLSHGPLTLTLPASGERYLSVSLMNMYSDNDAVLGARTVGGAGGRFTLVGPHQAGSGPDVVRLATPCGWLLGRTLVDGPCDLDALHAVQDGLTLEGPVAPPPRAYAGRDAGWAEYLSSAQALLVENPPSASDTAMLAALAPLGLDARGGFDPGRFDAAGAAEIEAGLADARAALQDLDPPPMAHGWAYPEAELGAFGQNYRLRAAVAVLGLAALPRAETMYMRPADAQGRRPALDDDGLYRLRFAPGQLPPVDGFWSLTLYEVTPQGQLFMAHNVLDRYSIGDRTPGLRTGADGSLDIWVSRRDPGGERRANWLPAPEAAPFTVTFRCYLPRPALLNGVWRLPPLERVED